MLISVAGEIELSPVNRNIRPSNSNINSGVSVSSSKDEIINGAVKTTGDSMKFDTEQIFRMYDNGVSYVRDTLGFKQRDRNYNMTQTVSTDLINVLARPVRIAVFTVNNVSTLLGAFNINNVIGTPMYTAKLANYKFYRADICYKLVVNAGVQTLGRIIMVSSPYETALDPTFQINGSTTITQLTCYPHVEVDIGSGETATLRIPYCAPFPRIPLGVYSAWSYVRISMMNPFVGLTSGETCEVSLYSWLENVELSIPTAQGLEDDEMDSKTEKPISYALSSLSTFAHSLNFIPMVGKWSSGVGWLSGLAAKAASALGYSKPMNNSSVHFMAQMPMRAFTHCEGSDDSVSLSLRPSNKVSVCPEIFGVKYDPQSFGSFLTRDHVLRTFPYSVSNNVDDVLLNILLGDAMPNSLYGIINTLYVYSAQSLVFRLSMVKNAFYSGRLIVEFIPTTTAPTTVWNPSNPSISFDIKTNKELVFRVPFTHYARVNDTVDYGRLVIRVLNPLHVNDTYPQTITGNLSMAVDTDVLFAGPQKITGAWAQGLADDECVECVPNMLFTHAIDILPTPRVSPNELLFVNGEYTATLLDLIKRSVAYSSYTNYSCAVQPGNFEDHFSSLHPLKRMSNFFRFWRGSFRIKFILRAPPSNVAGGFDENCVLSANVEHITANIAAPLTIPSPFISIHSSLPESRVCYRHNNVLEVQLPYYSSADFQRVGCALVGGGTCVNFYVETDPIKFPLPPVVDIYLSVGEDFSFGFPVGLPKY